MTDNPSGRRSASATGTWVRAVAGGVVWIVALLLVRPSPFDVAWAQALLLLAPLVLLPVGLHLASEGRDAGWPARLWQVVNVAQLPAALFLGIAYLVPQGLLAAGLAVP